MTEPRSAYQLAAQRDLQYLRQAQAGDRMAFGRIVLAWQDRIYNALRKITGNDEDAADLTQETFTRALGKLSSFRGESAVYTWLFRIAMNMAMTKLREKRRHHTVSEGQLAGEDSAGVLDCRPDKSADPPGAAMERQERNRLVMEALQRLDEEQRAMLVMRDIEQMDYQQIADLLRLPLGTMKSRLFRARMALRDELRGVWEAVA